MICTSCGGSGCEKCNQAGTFDIAECPMNLISNEVMDVIEYAELWSKGLPPVAGGALDQAKCFVMAAQFIFSEQNYWKKKKGIING